MIKNGFLQRLYNYSIESNDLDTAINQLEEYLKSEDPKFMESITIPVALDSCTEGELHFLTFATTIIAFKLGEKGLDIPSWVLDKRLSFREPFVYSRRLNQEDREKLIANSPQIFKKKNVYFDPWGLCRV